MSITGTEITRAEFDAISEKEGTFFANGCVFDEETENALALSDLLPHGGWRYYKLTRKSTRSRSSPPIPEYRSPAS